MIGAVFLILIEVGVRLLAESGEEGLSLRRLAREAGVSHNAPYMHFPDKEALMAAIAEQGFLLLGQGEGALKDYNAEHLALLLWMNVHGLIADKIPSYAMQGQVKDQLVDLSVEMICQGILKP